MASQLYKERLLKVVDALPDEKAEQVVQFAESLSPREPADTKAPFRPLGLYRGKIRIDPSFYDPLPDDILDAFEGKGE